MDQRRVDQALALDAASPLEARRHHQRAEVATPGGSARVARVEMALVYDLDVAGLETSAERRLDAFAPPTFHDVRS